MPTDTDTATITVLEKAANSGLKVAVSGPGSLLSGATVALVDSAGQRYSCTTTASGDRYLGGVPDGNWVVYAYAPGYQPRSAVTTVAHGNGELAMALPEGEVAVANLDLPRPLTLAKKPDHWHQRE